MIREVEYNGRKIEYELIRKNVRNINIRVKPDTRVLVSASGRISVEKVDEIILKRAEFILRAVDKFENNSEQELKPLHTVGDFSQIIADTFNEVNKSFHKVYDIPYPRLVMKNVRSKWGSCNYRDAVITLSSNLIYCTREQIYYVVVHEFSHLLVRDHSADFYNVVVKFCPDYKRLRSELNKKVIPR